MVVRAVLLLFATVSLGGQATSPAQGQPSTATVKVTDELGAVISKTFVVFRADSLERKDPKPFYLELRTNSEGEAKAVLPSGFYDVFVAQTGFAPYCQKLRVRDGKPVALKFVLKVDKLMADEYGDTFE
jgi:hypothetical protein